MESAWQELRSAALREALGQASGDPDLTLRKAQAEEGGQLTGGVLVVPVSGIIMQHESCWSEWGYATSTEGLVCTVREAMNNSAVSAVVLSVESPGGFVYGVAEATAALRALRDMKPLIAVANAYAASAAYWLVSAASEIVVTPSGEVGSIGVFCVHEDWSKAYEMVGITPTLVKAGKYKAEFSYLEPLSDEARQELQREVDETYAQFIADVAKGRGVAPSVVRGGFGEGRMVSAKAAVDQGMADRVATLDDVLQKLVGRGARRGARASDEGQGDRERRERQLRLATRA